MFITTDRDEAEDVAMDMECDYGRKDVCVARRRMRYGDFDLVYVVYLKGEEAEVEHMLDGGQ